MSDPLSSNCVVCDSSDVIDDAATCGACYERIGVLLESPAWEYREDDLWGITGGWTAVKPDVREAILSAEVVTTRVWKGQVC